MENDDYRKQRIERLLKELEYEVVRGVLEGEIDEQIGYRFVIPRSRALPNGIVMCEFRTRPMPRYAVHPDDFQPSLKVVK